MSDSALEGALQIVKFSAVQYKQIHQVDSDSIWGAWCRRCLMIDFVCSTNDEVLEKFKKQYEEERLLRS